MQGPKYVTKAEKIGRVMIRTSKNKQKKPYPFFSLWVFDSDVQGVLLFLAFKKHETWSLFILNSCKQISWVERVALLWSAPDGT